MQISERWVLPVTSVSRLRISRSSSRTARLWRRAITDPVTGVLLDYGTEQYLPEPLRRYVKARDGVCGTPASRTKASIMLEVFVVFRTSSAAARSARQRSTHGETSCQARGMMPWRSCRFATAGRRDR